MSKFIVVEGIDGAGKSTLVKNLEETLLEQGLEVVTTRDPGGSDRAEEIRQYILSEEGAKLSPPEQLKLFHEGRIDHVEKLIKPALKRGAVVISDRFELSMWVYQVWPDRDQMSEVYKKCEEEVSSALEVFDPHYLVLHLNTETALNRLDTVEFKNHFDVTAKELIEDRMKAYEAGEREVKGVFDRIDANVSADKVLESALKIII